jgi:uncharacterized protein YuzE
VKRVEIKAEVTYDREGNLAYIYLDEIPDGGIKKSIKVGDKVLDLDGEGRLLGIEILDGKAGLATSILKVLDGE